MEAPKVVAMEHVNVAVSAEARSEAVVMATVEMRWRRRRSGAGHQRGRTW